MVSRKKRAPDSDNGMSPPSAPPTSRKGPARGRKPGTSTTDPAAPCPIPAVNPTAGASQPQADPPLESALRESRQITEELREARQNLRSLQQQLQDAGRELAEFKQQFQDTRSEFHATRDQFHQECAGSAALQKRFQPDDPLALIEDPVPAPTVVVEDTTVALEGKKQLGVTVGASTSQVLEVLPETPAEKAGLQPGDMVVKFDGKPVVTGQDLRAAVQEAEAGKEVPLTVVHKDEGPDS